jgi:hypothetical protein
MLTAANLTLRFVLELAAIGAVGWWSFRTGPGPLAKAALGSDRRDGLGHVRRAKGDRRGQRDAAARV